MRGLTTSMKGYKVEQGRLARMAAFWSLALFLLFACTFIHGLLMGSVSMREPLGGIRIPIVGIDLNTAFLVSFGVFAIGMLFLLKWQQKPKVADLLIDTESELRKVTWPTMQEVMNSSMVVVLCVVMIGAFLAAADWLLAKVMKYLILGEV